jgi:uncharacterized protein GlcG (DUF336 family)
MAPAVTKSHPQLTLEGARIALEAAKSHAKKIGVPMNIAIVDAATHLLAFERMEGAKITSISIAMDKAFTASGHRVGMYFFQLSVNGIVKRSGKG